ncbi:MAG: DUF5615 family PIN-like protein [Candidatus Bathyarchaeota archaeon]|nr:DUF5615 family PIN-like protein [Candidatus Bathyarchaeota archaeon]
MPRILVDENVPRDVQEWLVKRGFDITSVTETQLRGAKDQAIGNYAAKNKLAVLTLDNHFSQVYRFFKGNQLTVIIIKAKPATPVNIIQTLDNAQKRINLKEVTGKLLIISKKKVRVIT